MLSSSFVLNWGDFLMLEKPSHCGRVSAPKEYGHVIFYYWLILEVLQNDL